MSLIGLTRIGGAPLYPQVADQLGEELRAHASPGRKLPPEEELAARFGVHRHTLRRAIDELVDAGLVERRHGLGTFVVRAPVTHALSGRTGFTTNLATLGREADSAVLRKQRIPAEGGVAARLQRAPGTPVAWVETLRRVDRRLDPGRLAFRRARGAAGGAGRAARSPSRRLRQTRGDDRDRVLGHAARRADEPAARRARGGGLCAASRALRRRAHRGEPAPRLAGTDLRPLLVLAFGFGPAAGVLALALHSAGFLGKFFAEDIENADRKPQEAMAAIGAGRLRTLWVAVLPQVLPQDVAYVLDILDRNLRMAAVIGLVGAGGIGQELKGR